MIVSYLFIGFFYDNRTLRLSNEPIKQQKQLGEIIKPFIFNALARIF